MATVPEPGGTKVTRVTDPSKVRMLTAKNWNSLLPVPDYFYDIRSTLAPIASLRLIRVLSVCLYLFTACVFVGTQVFYAMPSQLLSEESIVSQEWQQAGYKCQPLQDANLHGFTTLWSFDDCVAGVNPPNDTNIVEVFKALDNSTHLDFRFASDEGNSSGVFSAYDEWLSKYTILQKTGDADDWKLEGYTCRQEFPADSNMFNVTYNYDECMAAFQPPSAETVNATSAGIYHYFPFGTGRPCYPDEWTKYQSRPKMETRLLAAYPSISTTQGERGNYGGARVKACLGEPVSSGQWLSSFPLDEGMPAGDWCFPPPYDLYCFAGANASLSKYAIHGNPDQPATLENDGYGIYYTFADQPSGSNCLTIKKGRMHSFDGVRASTPINVTEALTAWNKLLSTAPDQFGGFGADFICSEFKRNANGFRCWDVSAGAAPSFTRAEAIEHYSAKETIESLCAPLKKNSPFLCTRDVEVPLVTRLNLSLAASQALFGMFGIFAVYLLRRTEAWLGPPNRSGAGKPSSIKTMFSSIYEMMPIPDYFYDVKNPIPLIGNSTFRVKCMVGLQYIFMLGVFAAAITFYSSPAQLLSDENIVTTEWQQDGYVCEPLQEASLHGLSTSWSFDECVALVNPPSDTSIIEVEKNGNSTHYDYRFASIGNSSGVLSAFDNGSVSLPSSRAEAIEHYAAESSPESLCAPLKKNKPFRCTREVEVPLLTRLTLSFAIGQTAFDLFGFFLVFMLRRVSSWQRTFDDDSTKPSFKYDDDSLGADFAGSKMFSFVYDLMPIPDYYYDVKTTVPLISPSLFKIHGFARLLYLISCGIFSATLLYYSTGSQRLTDEIIITREWQQDGYNNCKPLQEASLHGLSTSWSFDECVARVKPPSHTSIIEVEKNDGSIQNDGSTHLDYRFASIGNSSGVLSAFDDWTAASILQATGGEDDWKREGYSCYPESPYRNTFNVRYNYSECLDVVLPATLTGGVRRIKCNWSPGDGFWDCNDGTGQDKSHYIYYPFGTNYSCYPNAWPALGNFTITGRCTALGGCAAAGASKLWFSYGMDMGAKVMGSSWGSTLEGCFGQEWTEYSNGDFGVYTNAAWINHANEFWNVTMSKSDGYGGFGTEFICSAMKNNTNGFRCWDDSKAPPSTLVEAMKRYSAENTPESLCAPLKKNSPFECSRKAEVPLLARLNLSLAAAQSIFAAFGMLFVNYLRRSSPKKFPVQGS